jgi:uncharacterized protein (DUF4213/DUF364 family)
MFMTVISDLREILLREVPNMDKIKVERVCLGLGYTGVKLNGGQSGFCHTVLSEMKLDCCRILENAGTLAGKSSKELLSLANSWDFSERVIGIATINALSQIVLDSNKDNYAIEKANLVDVIDIEPDNVVALIGLISPFVPVFKAKAKELYILERGSAREKGMLPDTACEEIVPKADIVVITGSALSNGTLDRLLQLSSNARTIALVGPTASCVPDPLFKRGVDYVGGIRIYDADKAMQVIAEGGGTPRLRMAGEFVTFKAR